MNRVIIVLFIFCMLVSCRKNRDENYPTISFQAPTTNSSFNVLAPIPFTINASDETKLESITVRLLNDAYNPVASAQTFFPQENSVTVQGSLITTDIHLATGTYYLKAEAYDGTNRKIIYREINLIAVPRQLKRTFVFSGTNSILQVDSIGTSGMGNALTLNTDFGGASVSSYHQQIMIGGAASGNLNVYGADYFDFRWTETNPQTHPTFYTAFLEFGSKIFIATANGKIRSFQKNAQVFDVIDVPNQYISSMSIADDKIILTTKNNVTGQNAIQVYFISSGTFMQSINISFGLNQVFYIGNDQCIITGNDNGIGRILFYDIASNNSNEPAPFLYGKIFDALPVNNELLIASSNGLIGYHLVSFAQTVHNNTSAFHHIAFDDLNSILYLSYQNNLSEYTYPGLNPVGNFVLSDSIFSIQNLYNK